MIALPAFAWNYGKTGMETSVERICQFWLMDAARRFPRLSHSADGTDKPAVRRV